jgi:hypothetical protein
VKTCPNCSRRHSPAAWRALAYVGIQSDGIGGRVELRQCVCRSTLGVVMAEDEDDDVFAPLRRVSG